MGHFHMHIGGVKYVYGWLLTQRSDRPQECGQNGSASSLLAYLRRQHFDGV